MSELLWVKEQMNLRKLANQFLSKVKSTGANRVLITSVNKGDGKARFMSELAAEMARVNQELVPLAAANLHIVNPAKFKDKLVVVYGPSYFETDGLHTIPERWMRAFDAVVVIVMARRTRSKDLVKLITWLKEYNYQNIWPILNEKLSPDISESWMRFKERIGVEKETPKRLSRGNAASVWQPLLPPPQEIEDDYSVLSTHETKDVVIIPNKPGDVHDASTEELRQDNVAAIRNETILKKTSSDSPLPAVSLIRNDIEHTETLQGSTRIGVQRLENLVAQPTFVQSARATIRSSAPPLAKSISSNPPPRREIDNPLTMETIQHYPPSAKSTIISSVPPPSLKKTVSDPPQGSALKKDIKEGK
jgi:hypothetical protein